MENLHFFTRQKKLCRKLGKCLHMSFFFLFLSNLKTLYQDKNRKFPKNANFLKCFFSVKKVKLFLAFPNLLINFAPTKQGNNVKQ